MSVTEHRHRADLVAAGDLLLSEEPSFLETRAVKPATRADYERRKHKFEQDSELTLQGTSLDVLEVALLEYFDEGFLQGETVHFGLKLMSALAFFRPQLRGAAKTGILPRVRLALQGWLRVAPGV